MTYSRIQPPEVRRNSISANPASRFKRPSESAERSASVPPSKRWCINGRFLDQQLTGVQRYAQEIVRALDSLVAERHPLAANIELCLVGPRGTREKVSCLGLIATAVSEHGASQGHLWEQLELPLVKAYGLLNLANTGPLLRRRQVLCIHDVNTHAAPESYSLPFRLAYRTLQPALGRVVKAVTTVSEYSAGELVRYGIATRDKISIAPNGHCHALRWQPRRSQATRALEGKTTIAVIGSKAPHKNIGLLVSLAEPLAQANISIAIVGTVDRRVFHDRPIDHRLPNVYWLGHLRDDELAALLSQSLCLAFPSFVEGFGVPLVEAMAWNCPVVASDRASIPEISADAALYAAPNDPVAWLAHFLRLRDNPGLRSELIQRGKARLPLFTWRASALKYLEIMSRI
jgi:glycosyltransferase involved in cell wall biosynthesis